MCLLAFAGKSPGLQVRVLASFASIYRRNQEETSARSVSNGRGLYARLPVRVVTLGQRPSTAAD